MIRCLTYNVNSRPPYSDYGLVTADWRAHLYRLGVSHTPDCSCETGPQTPEHILQSCPIYQDARTQYWPHGATLAEKLWGTKQDLDTTTNFIIHTRLEI
ncbi:hypothetical protein V1264_009614 [Littorina saxatilis]|uniref:Uncharacterized protein n=1 Tax=Littorina saxatilis TaxID=31220 RepID=A0AAN9ART8_9CAEN